MTPNKLPYCSHIERGPSGHILVINLSDEDRLADGLMNEQNQLAIASVLPVYSRDHREHLQLCVEITGHSAINELDKKDYPPVATRRQIISRFLLSLFDALDQYIPPEAFIFDPACIFWDPLESKLSWVCLPLASRDLSLVDRRDDIELMLMHPFFSDALKLDVDILLHLLDDDTLLRQKLSAIQKPPQKNPCLNRYFGNLTFCLAGAIWLVVGCISFYLLFLLIEHMLVAIGLWIILHSLIFYLVYNYRKNKTANNKPALSCKSSIMRDVMFPKNDAAALLHRPALLIASLPKKEQCGYPSRHVVLVSDFLIGRDVSICDLFIDDLSIGQMHARIIRRDDQFFLVDLGSIAGTFLGDRRLYSYQEALLRTGDHIRFGSHAFRFCHD